MERIFICLILFVWSGGVKSEAKQTTDIAPCGNTNHTAVAEGTISNPGYPKPYPGTKYGYACSQVIHVPPGKKLEWNVAEFRLPGKDGNSVCFEKVIITVDNHASQEYCGKNAQIIITTEAKQLLNVTLNVGGTAFTYTRMFLIKYKLVCAADVADVAPCEPVTKVQVTEGTIQSPGYPQPYTLLRSGMSYQCVWEVNVDKGKQLQWKWLSRELPQDEHTTTSCSDFNTWINVTVDEKAEMKYCHTLKAEENTINATRTLRVVFHGSGKCLGKFKITFEQIDFKGPQQENADAPAKGLTGLAIGVIVAALILVVITVAVVVVFLRKYHRKCAPKQSKILKDKLEENPMYYKKDHKPSLSSESEQDERRISALYAKPNKPKFMTDDDDKGNVRRNLLSSTSSDEPTTPIVIINNNQLQPPVSCAKKSSTYEDIHDDTMMSSAPQLICDMTGPQNHTYASVYNDIPRDDMDDPVNLPENSVIPEELVLVENDLYTESEN